MRRADLQYDVEDRGGYPCCFDCLERLIEYENAIGIADEAGIGVELRELLPHPFVRPGRPVRPSMPTRRGDDDNEKMEGLARGWERFMETAEREGMKGDA
jgi:hypothetical protein